MQGIKSILSQEFTIETCEKILEEFKEIHVSKNQIIINLDSSVNDLYFIENGLIRTFYIDDKGNEITFDFYKNGEFITLLDSFLHGKSSQFFVESLQPCTLFKISKIQLDKLIALYPKLNELKLRLIINYTEKSVNRTFLHQIPVAKDRLLKFTEYYPNVLYNCKNKDVASFLRLTKESFSRLINQK